MSLLNRSRLLFTLSLTALAPLTHAQTTQPARPISHRGDADPAGGVSDTLSCALADKVAAQLGISMVIENKAGASAPTG